MPTLQIDGLSAPLRVVRYAGREAMSDAFEFELHVVTDDAQVAFADVIGRPADFLFDEAVEGSRHARGLIRRFEYLHHHSRHATYRAILVPRAFRLTLRRNNRIFQGKTAPQIIEAVIGEAEIEAHTLALSGSYATREYCVQYRETDWDFINRLMEEEGIFYYFEHGAEATKLVIADGPSVHNPIEGDPRLKLRRDTGALAAGEHVSSLHYGEELRPGKITMRDYNFKTPKLSLEASSKAESDDDLEVYDYPGNYADPGAGKSMTARRLEALQAPRKTGEGHSNCARLTPGSKFTLDDGVGEALREDLAQEYLVTHVEHEGQDPRMVEGGDVVAYSNRFWVVPATVPFRPAPRTPRPRIYGVQTAVVTGAAGEEIHTDEHGRIKVQFFWDRLGKGDENSSCWIRVKQPWAGPAWGHLFIPRVGQEVVVEFVEGDPDRPLCSGAVYHAANVPPYPLPAEKTKSTLKTESTVGGGGYNELRFEDLKGKEEIYLQGEKDWNILIKNDKNQTIGHDETLDVGNDQTIHVGHDRSKTVDNDQIENIGGNKTINVAKNHSETIQQNESITVAGNADLTINGTRSTTVVMAHVEKVGLAQTSTVGGAWAKNVGAAMALTVAGGKVESVGSTSRETVGGDKTTAVTGSYAVSVAQNHDVNVTKNMTVDIAENKTENVKKTVALIVGEKLKVEVGKAIITIDKSGDISVEGNKITVKGEGPIEVSGKKLKVESDGTIDIKGSGKITVKGSDVGIN
ncbi:type VI secretion system Vgr family protein [Sorangium sp. So ce131]|uniref:type VI secretion system Vgr family protein n=1 Tax=Sorangium sp. So ce131 TaxID=3133282 RepID=UPI003F5DCEFC